MSDHRHFVFAHDTARRLAAAACMTMPAGYHCRITPPTRSLEANSKLWAMLTEVSQQVVWHGKKLTPDEWKMIFSAALKRQEVMIGLDGGFVVMAQSTSKMTKKEMSDLIELIHAFGANNGVRFAE